MRPLSLILLGCVVGLLPAAPTPPKPKQMQEEFLYGTWDYEYGSQLGWISFNKEGYSAQHQPNSTNLYFGKWKITADGDIQLEEYAASMDDGIRSGPCTYTFKANLKKYPFVYEGDVYNGTARMASYKLSKRKSD